VSPVIRHDRRGCDRIANGTYGPSSPCANRFDLITHFVRELHVGSVNVREVPGYRLELTPFGGIKDSGLGYKEGVIEAMKGFCNTKTYSLPW
jgi:aldehyde dehydrogenase (NAD+)